MGPPVLPSQDSPSVSSSIGERTSYRKLQTPRCGTGSVTIAPVRVHYSTLTYLRRGGDAANEVREVEVVSHVSILACGVLREPSRADLRTSRSGLSGLSGEVGRCLPGYAPGALGCVIGGHPFNIRFPVGGNPMSIARLLSLVVVTVLLFASVPIGAQQPVAPPPPQIPYGAPINLEQAKKVLVGAEAEAKKNKWNMVIAVLDSGGHLVMLERMDGTQLGSIEAAKDKAYSAVLYRRPTKVFQDLVGQGGSNLRLLRLAGASPLEGGIPITVDGKIVGAVGVSGATSEQDAQVAKAGADALTK